MVDKNSSLLDRHYNEMKHLPQISSFPFHRTSLILIRFALMFQLLLHLYEVGCLLWFWELMVDFLNGPEEACEVLHLATSLTEPAIRQLSVAASHAAIVKDDTQRQSPDPVTELSTREGSNDLFIDALPENPNDNGDQQHENNFAEATIEQKFNGDSVSVTNKDAFSPCPKVTSPTNLGMTQETHRLQYLERVDLCETDTDDNVGWMTPSSEAQQKQDISSFPYLSLSPIGSHSRRSIASIRRRPHSVPETLPPLRGGQLIKSKHRIQSLNNHRAFKSENNRLRLIEFCCLRSKKIPRPSQAIIQSTHISPISQLTPLEGECGHDGLAEWARYLQDLSGKLGEYMILSVWPFSWVPFFSQVRSFTEVSSILV